MASQTVGIREAKANLSRYLKRIRQGDEIILTEHGRPVGKIVPIQAEDLSLADRLRRLEDKGLIEPADSREAEASPRLIPIPEGIAQRILQEDRDHG